MRRPHASVPTLQRRRWALAQEHDAWATYLKQKTQPVVRPIKSKKPDPPQRAKWVELKVDLTQAQGQVQQLTPDAFGSNTTGIALLTRQMFLEASAVRSNSPLAVILPGDRNEALISAGINESAIQVRSLALHRCCGRTRPVTLIGRVNRTQLFLSTLRKRSLTKIGLLSFPLLAKRFLNLFTACMLISMLKRAPFLPGGKLIQKLTEQVFGYRPSTQSFSSKLQEFLVHSSFRSIAHR